jgi:hypothetical protein
VRGEEALPRRHLDGRQVPTGVIAHLQVGCEHALMLRVCLWDERTRCCVGVGKNGDEVVRSRDVVSEGKLANSKAAYNAQGRSSEGSPR